MSRYHKEIQQIRALFDTKNVIPLHAPTFRGNEKKYVNETLDSTFVSSVGSFVNRFEEVIAQTSNTSKGVALVNGTAALYIALKLAKVGRGDEVITQALSFVATANAISYTGAKPVFLDVDIDTMGLSPNAVENYLEEYGDLREEGCFNKKTGARIAACVPMHTFGFMCNMNPLLDLCIKWKIPVVEDSAEAVGSEYLGKPAGSMGLIGVFSFNGNKIITGGGGGALVSMDKNIVDRGKHLTSTAKVNHAWEYVHDDIGYNFRMPNLNAALLCAQLEQLQTFVCAKSELYKDYQVVFEKSGLKLKTIPEHTTKWNHWLISLEMDNRKERNLFLKQTNASGVLTRPIWRLMYKLPMYQDCQRDAQANAEFLEDRIVNIPSSVRG